VRESTHGETASDVASDNEQNEDGMRVFIGTAQCDVSEVLSSRPASGPGAERNGCRRTELSVKSDTSDSAAVFCIHYCFNCYICSVNNTVVRPRVFLLQYAVLRQMSSSDSSPVQSSPVHSSPVQMVLTHFRR
jgi:hypothetical protein